MNRVIAILPTRKTQQPSRKGLVFHEILADGIVHVAAVFGIEEDERFVERVAILAWSSGAHLVQQDVPRATQVAQRLSESLEVGRSEAQRRCTEFAAAVVQAECTFSAIRAHYQKHFGTRSLGITDPVDVGAIRQLIGEAALYGILCRGLAPLLYQAIKAQNDLCCLETEYLRMVLLLWSQGNGFPPCHPFIEMTECLYRQRPYERELICGAMGRLLPGILEQGDPWELENWLTPAWREGIMQTKFAPDVVAAAMAEFEEGELQTNHEIFDLCIQGTERPDGRVDLDAAFAKYLEQCNPYGLGNVELKKMCPRFLAARAFDFAMWMGILAGLPIEQGGKRGVM
jgi:hypothetical protein